MSNKEEDTVGSPSAPAGGPQTAAILVPKFPTIIRDFTGRYGDLQQPSVKCKYYKYYKYFKFIGKKK